MSEIERIGPSLLEALRERGHSDDAILRMTPEKAFDEWCGWHLGDPNWGVQLRSIMKSAAALRQSKEPVEVR